MSVKVGPKIVTNGLVCDLDPATNRSYSGSGNTWYDLSSNRFNQALTGVAFTTDNKGLMNYSAGNSYTALNSAVNIEGPLTLSYWIKYTSVSGVQTLGITNGTNSPTSALLIGIRPNGQGLAWKYGGNLISFTNPVVNTWYHYGLTYASNSMFFYINGKLDNSTTVVGNTGAAVSLNIGDYLSDGSGNEKIIGYLGNFQLYNRALTAQEILQNYNATKGRYI